MCGCRFDTSKPVCCSDVMSGSHLKLHISKRGVKSCVISFFSVVVSRNPEHKYRIHAGALSLALSILLTSSDILLGILCSDGLQEVEQRKHLKFENCENRTCIHVSLFA